MATRFSSTLVCTCNTDAVFRAWVQFIEDTFVTTGGWVITADTGQMVIATALHPVGNWQKTGYRIYRMADTLQATKPVFLRIDYGAGPSNIPAFYITVGTGSDGAGNITGQMFTSGNFVTGTSGNSICGNSSSASAFNSYGSAATNRCTLGVWAGGGSASLALIFSIERTKSPSGADTGDGLLLIYTGYPNSSGLNRSQYIIYGSPGPQPVVEQGVSYVLTSQNPTQSYGGDIGIGVINCFKGYAQQPGIGVLIVNAADMASESQFSATLYGTTRTYQHMAGTVPWKSLVNNMSADSNARVAILYE